MATTTALSETLVELRDSNTPPSAQISRLKSLRNEVIGHAANKSFLVRQGLLEVLAISLANASRARGKQRSQDTNGASAAVSPARQATWSEQDEVCLQALIVLGSLATGQYDFDGLDPPETYAQTGGPAFVAPIRDSGILSHLIACLSPADNDSRIVDVALKALVTICDMASQAHICNDTSDTPSLDLQTHYPTLVRVFVDVLSQNTPSSIVQRQISLCAQLIHYTAMAERHRTLCLRAGVLDLLAARLAAYYEKQGFYTQRAQATAAFTKTSLPPAPTRQVLTHILKAIATIVQRSRYRIARLLYSPFVLSVLPFTSPEEPLSLASQRTFNHVEMFLPRIHSGSNKEDRQHSKAFPALGAVQPKDQKYAALMDFDTSGYNTPMRPLAPESQESSMVSWLIYTLRNEHGLARLEAATLLTAIARAGFFGKRRDRQLALLVVPLLVAAMEEPALLSGDQAEPETSSPATQAEERIIQARAPRILADLIKDSPRLQEAAVDAGAIPKVSKALKKTFATIEAKIPLWSAEPSSSQSGSSTEEVTTAARSLGQAGIRPDILHIYRCRQAALVLVAVLGAKEDKYRKQLTDQGLVAIIIDALAPLQQDALADLSSSARRDKLDTTYGNPDSVLLAACNAARSLSRSVSLLRTSLIDAGIAAPIYALLKHSSVPVLIAASDVICNLITDVSPMRQYILDQGAIQILCEHAHSADSRVRLVSLWALKHLVYSSSTEIKEQTFEALGTGWLVKIIQGHPSNSLPATRQAPTFSMGAANAAGERVDILNAVDEPMDLGEEHGGNPETSLDTDDDVVVPPIFPAGSELANAAAQHRERLLSIRDDELAMAARASYREEQQIQVQGLDFVRNFIQGPSASTMIDLLFRNLTASRVFDMIASKLRPASEAGNQAPPTEVVSAAVFVCVHIAAGEPKHRLLLMSQPELLGLLLPLLHHPDPGVRVSCVWCVSNLTWVDDQADAPAARQRAFELRAMGFEDELRSLHRDESLDVRERASTAVDQMRELVNGDAGQRRMGLEGVESFAHERDRLGEERPRV